jgi:hypothetical protein
MQQDTSKDGTLPRSLRAPVVPARPSERALTHLDDAGRRVRWRRTQIRRSFINAERGDGSEAPLARIVKGGRAGGVRLRLMLGLLWMGGGGDYRHEVSFPARAWAELLDLRDPPGAGQRRVREALAWLERERLINVVRAPGRPLKVKLLREDGSGAKYVAPTSARKDPATKKLRRADWSVGLPSTFWTEGWAITLSTPALAILLALVEMERDDGAAVWVSPEKSRERFGLSEDTWTRGVAELEAQGLVDVKRRPVDQTFRWTRVRNTYRLLLSRLATPPIWATPDGD